MGENQMNQILTQEMIRRLSNTREDLPEEDSKVIIDRYSQKLINSGHGDDQIRSIVVAVNRCREEERRLRRTAKDSKEARMRTKLLGRTTGFKKRKGGQKKDLYGKNGAKKGMKQKSKDTGTTSTPKTVIFLWSRLREGSWQKGSGSFLRN